MPPGLSDRNAAASAMSGSAAIKSGSFPQTDRVSLAVDPLSVVRPGAVVERGRSTWEMGMQEQPQDCENGEERRLVDDTKAGTYWAVDQDGCDGKVTMTGGRTPLPYKQVFLVLAMLFTEPMAYSQVYPVSRFYCFGYSADSNQSRL